MSETLEKLPRALSQSQSSAKSAISEKYRLTDAQEISRDGT